MMLSMNHDSTSAMMIFILDSSNGGVIGDSFFTNSTGGMLLNNYEVDNYLYSVKGWIFVDPTRAWGTVFRIDLSTGELNATMGLMTHAHSFFKIPGDER